MLGKIGGKASEDVILQLVRTKMPVLLYGLEACPLRKSVSSSLDSRVRHNSCHKEFGQDRGRGRRTNL